MELPREWAQMDAQKLRDLAATLIAQLAEREAQCVFRSVVTADSDLT
jgi:hypothetical protein